MVERKRPVLSITVSEDVKRRLEDLARRSNRSVSRVAEMCIVLGMPRYEQLLGQKSREYQKKKRMECEMEERSKELSEEYWKQVLLGEYKWWEWKQV